MIMATRKRHAGDVPVNPAGEHSRVVVGDASHYSLIAAVQRIAS